MPRTVGLNPIAIPTGIPKTTAANSATRIRPRLAARCCQSVASIKPCGPAMVISFASTCPGGGKNSGLTHCFAATAHQIANSTSNVTVLKVI
ncbi:hypothetical protein D3C72_1806350 [compost metagenome]